MWESGRIAGSSALEHTTSHLRVQAQECWVVLQVGAADHLGGKKQHTKPSNSWREAPVCSQSPWRSLTPLFSAGTRGWQHTNHVGGFWIAFVTASRQVIKELTAGLLGFCLACKEKLFMNVKMEGSH